MPSEWSLAMPRVRRAAVVTALAAVALVPAALGSSAHAAAAPAHEQPAAAKAAAGWVPYMHFTSYEACAAAQAHFPGSAYCAADPTGGWLLWVWIW
jgi:hypothetical protein